MLFQLHGHIKMGTFWTDFVQWGYRTRQRSRERKNNVWTWERNRVAAGKATSGADAGVQSCASCALSMAIWCCCSLTRWPYNAKTNHIKLVSKPRKNMAVIGIEWYATQHEYFILNSCCESPYILYDCDWVIVFSVIVVCVWSVWQSVVVGCCSP